MGSDIDHLNEGIASMGRNVKDAYAKWPPGHRMHANMPGFIAGLMHEGVDCEMFTAEQAPQVLDRIYAAAGLPGHAHIAEAKYALKELLAL